jgi:Tfp pilus assembly protein PilO
MSVNTVALSVLGLLFLVGMGLLFYILKRMATDWVESTQKEFKDRINTREAFRVAETSNMRMKILDLEEGVKTLEKKIRKITHKKRSK